MLHSYSITVSGLMAQSRAANAYADNIANINAVPRADGTSYVPKDVVSISQENGGVSTAMVENPDATLEDQVLGLMTAETGYKANAKLIGVQRDMDDALLDILS